MNISSQHQPLSNELIGTLGKKQKKESLMDALMKLGDTSKKEKTNEVTKEATKEVTKNTKKESKKKQELFSLEQHMSFEKIDHEKPISLEQPFNEKKLLVQEKMQKTETKDNVSVQKKTMFPTTELKLETNEKKPTSMQQVVQEKTIIPSVTTPFPLEKATNNTPPSPLKQTERPSIEHTSFDFSKPTPKAPMTLADIKQEQQIAILKDLAKQLSEPTSKQETFTLTEGVKNKTTVIQLLQHEKSGSLLSEAKKGTEVVFTQANHTLKESKRTKEIDTTKSDYLFGDSKLESTLRHEPIKTESVREIKSLITQEIEQYVEFKEVNAKKISIAVQHEELGKIDLVIEKKEDKIYILLRMDDTSSKKEIEQTLELLKEELKEKDIQMEYEVEQDGQQKEKRKEQEQMTEKENKRENQGKKENAALKFDELLEAGL